MVRAVGRGLATAEQYIVPILCLTGAAISAWRRHTRRSLIDNVPGSDAPDNRLGVYLDACRLSRPRLSALKVGRL